MAVMMTRQEYLEKAEEQERIAEFMEEASKSLSMATSARRWAQVYRDAVADCDVARDEAMERARLRPCEGC